MDSNMSSRSVRRVLRQDLQLVQNLIEHCLLLYMNQKKVVKTLLDQAKIEPVFTELVWQKLEEDNGEFFRAYYLRLMVKNQITEFNRLLEQQVQLMRQRYPTGVASMATSNGSHISPLHQNSTCYAPEHTGPAVKLENIHHPIGYGLSDAFTNGGSLLHPSMHAAFQMSSHSSGFDVPPNMLSAQSLNVDMIQGINGGMINSETGYLGSSPYMFNSDAMINSETGYLGSSPYMFNSDGNAPGVRPTIGDASVASFTSIESNLQPVAESIRDANTSSFGFLRQIPQNFGHQFGR